MDHEIIVDGTVYFSGQTEEDPMSEVERVFAEYEGDIGDPVNTGRMETVEVEEGVMIPDGFHLEYDNKPDNEFYDPALSEEENAFLNLEITPQIEALIYELAEDKGLILQPIVEDEIDDNYVELVPTVDHERKLEEAIPMLDDYFAVSKLLDKAIEKFGWGELVARRDKWWSFFKEEVDTNWLRVDQLDKKVDRRLFLLAREDKEPTEEQWEKLFTIRGNFIKEAMELEKARMSHTYAIYQKALKATADCREFWNTPQGKAINMLREERKQLYKKLTESDGDKSVPWDYCSAYFQLRDAELNPFFTSGDTQAVDDPELIKINRTPVEGYMDTHLLEERNLEQGDVYWEKWYASWLERKEGYLSEVDSQMRAIDEVIEATKEQSDG